MPARRRCRKRAGPAPRRTPGIETVRRGGEARDPHGGGEGAQARQERRSGSRRRGGSGASSSTITSPGPIASSRSATDWMSRTVPAPPPAARVRRQRSRPAPPAVMRQGGEVLGDEFPVCVDDGDAGEGGSFEGLPGERRDDEDFPAPVGSTTRRPLRLPSPPPGGPSASSSPADKHAIPACWSNLGIPKDPVLCGVQGEALGFRRALPCTRQRAQPFGIPIIRRIAAGQQ